MSSESTSIKRHHTLNDISCFKTDDDRIMSLAHPIKLIFVNAAAQTLRL